MFLGFPTLETRLFKPRVLLQTCSIQSMAWVQTAGSAQGKRWEGETTPRKGKLVENCVRYELLYFSDRSKKTCKDTFNRPSIGAV